MDAFAPGAVRIAVHIAARGVELRAVVPGAEEVAAVTEEQGAIAGVEGEEDQTVEVKEREPDGAPPASPLVMLEHERRQEQCAPVPAPEGVWERDRGGRERETAREREGEKERKKGVFEHRQTDNGWANKASATPSSTPPSSSRRKAGRP